MAWETLWARRIALFDGVVVSLSVFTAQLLRDSYFGEGVFQRGHTLVSLGVIVAWWVMLRAYGAHDPNNAGAGVGSEYRPVLDATLMVFGLFAIWALLVDQNAGRGYTLVALPVGLLLLLASRAFWRARLLRARRDGQYLRRTLMLGSPHSADPIAAQLRKHRSAGYDVVATVGSLPTDASSMSAVYDAVTTSAADTVMVTGFDALSPVMVRELSWGLDERGVQLVLAPSLTDVSGPRIHMTPVAGMSLLQVEMPTYTGINRFLKRSFDLLGALSILAVLAVPMAIVAAIIKLTSPGPVFFSHERIGRKGEPFRMIKFRSMRPGADDELADLLAERQADDTPLFKIVDDPRITPIGRFIRKYSIDELPQLFNVVKGDMSLVGPRPQVAAEVALYDQAAHRRLTVPPGMTGLWQVSGRSSLSWEEAIRLDLYYVENWSMTMDLTILFRTVRAVIAPSEDEAH